MFALLLCYEISLLNSYIKHVSLSLVTHKRVKEGYTMKFEAGPD